MTETVKGYAKINLHFDVRGIREDGYHSVNTIMQSISLCDDVSVTLTDGSDIVCECNKEGVPTDDKNIAVRAARLYFDSTRVKSGAIIKINKNIPMAAGLAGGSADAAATLVALNRLFENKLDEAELCKLGADLGADVPFCIACGTLFSDGRGDVLHSFPKLDGDVIFAVACGGEGVSTPWGYRLLDEEFDSFKDYEPRSLDGIREAIGSGDALDFSKHLFNVFEAPVLMHRPVVKEVKDVFLSCGAENALMSGSGPSVYAVFKDSADAQRAVDKILDMGYFGAIAKPVETRFAIYS